jgi:D-alanyl-D-alanine dipeptidase
MRFFKLIHVEILLFACFYVACDDNSNKSHSISLIKNDSTKVEKNSTKATPEIYKTHLITSEIEQSIINAGLIDIHTIDSSIVVNLKYSTTDNFLGIDVYGDFNKCYLQPDVAQKLKQSQAFLRSKFSYYNLIVFDAVRPRSIQSKMWDTIDIPLPERTRYLSNPKNGSLHNFGAAVDISIIDEHGIEMDMGTKYDYFGELAYPREEKRMQEEGKLSYNQLLNRELLRNVMQHGGFFGIATEWWHFNSCNRDKAYEKYKIVE